MNVVVGTPAKVQAIVTEATAKLGPPGIETPAGVREVSAAVASGMLLFLSAAFVSPLDHETVVLVSVSERETARALTHEALHVALNRLGEPAASKALDLLHALGREVKP